MFDGNLLWKQRLRETRKELGKYLPYIFNGHFVIVLFFLLGTAAYYYQAWVKTLNPDFPSAGIMAVVLSFLVTYSPIYTLLREADRVFLLPLEDKMKPYFQKSFLVSFSLQVYGLILGLAVFMPMYAQVNGGNFKAFFIFLMVLCGLKIVNMLIRWRVQYYTEISVHSIDSIIRYFGNGVFLYFLFSNAKVWLFAPLLLIYAFLYYYYGQQTNHKGLKWEFLIDQEERRMMSFYRFANMFTDVPKLKSRVKRRRWLEGIVRSIPYGQENSYLFLFLITFIRGGDFLGLFVRLTLIGMIGLYFITFGYGQILFVLLFLFLTGFQLFPLWNHHQNKVWIRLYPVKMNVKEHSFMKILYGILIMQTVLLSLPLLMKEEWMMAFLSQIAGVIFSFSFVFIYIKKKLRMAK